MNSLARILPLALVLTACGGSSTESTRQEVLVTGTITIGGQPGPAIVTLGIEGSSNPGLSVGVFGTYRLVTEVASSDCQRLFVQAFFLNSVDQPIAEETKPLGSCGTHVVDFEHNP
ncbi:MAG: hypothetical protein IH968_14340 [Gemmatimonadetes bacterium]|nr:hypothetical protein [Gemmatimonadota bacterium]